MNNDYPPPPSSWKFAQLQAVLASMDDQEIIEAFQQMNLYIAARFNDTR